MATMNRAAAVAHTYTVPTAHAEAGSIRQHAIIAYGRFGEFEDWHTDRDGNVIIFTTEEEAMAALPEARELLEDPDDESQEIIVVTRVLHASDDWRAPYPKSQLARRWRFR